MVEDVWRVDDTIAFMRDAAVEQIANRMLPKPAKEFWPVIESMGQDRVLIRARGFYKAEQAYSLSLFLSNLSISHEFRGTKVLIVNETQFIQIFK